jgi:hypothetical protein
MDIRFKMKVDVTRRKGSQVELKVKNQNKLTNARTTVLRYHS